MFDFFRSMFRPERSSSTAKERLRLVLLSDHLSLAPDVVEALKADLLEVISRYVEIDANNADVSFEQREHEVAMLASIPIRQLRADRPMPAARSEQPTPTDSPAPALSVRETEAVAVPVTETTGTAQTAEEPAAVQSLTKSADAQAEAESLDPQSAGVKTVTVDAATEWHESTLAPVRPPQSGTNGTRKRRRRKTAQQSSVPPPQISQPQVS